MWLLLYASDQSKKLESLIAAINSGNYIICAGEVSNKIIELLKKDQGGKPRYLELENPKEIEKAKKNMGLDSLPALVLMDTKNKEICDKYYESDILIPTFGFPQL